MGGGKPMLKRFISSVALIAVCYVPLQYAHAANLSAIIVPAPPAPIQQTVMLAYIQPVAFTELQPLALMPYPYSPMNTYYNTYASGNCTYGVASMKKEIPASWGNADTWAYYARLEGVTVSDVPIVGAVAQTTAGWAGHVAVVTALNADGTIEITEMNYDGWGDGLYRTRTAAISEFQYIYI